MSVRFPFAALALVLAGCAAGAPAPSAVEAPRPAARYALQDLGAAASVEIEASIFDDGRSCGQVVGFGDSHPGDGRFYELVVDARRAGNAVSGTVTLYTMADVLGAPTVQVDPRVYRGTVTKLAVKGERAWARGVLDNGESFALEVLDQATGPIREETPFDWFWFDTEGLHAEAAHIHEGDLEVTPKSCLPLGL